MLLDFKYIAPTTKAEFLRLLNKNAETCKIIAGGTDLMVEIRAGLKRPEIVLDLKKIEEFKGLNYTASEGLSIGASVTCTDVLDDANVAKHYPVLATAAAELATIQVRNRATIVGNICNASPCADTALPLLCLDASVLISSESGSRTVKVKDFFVGVKKNVLQKNEIVEKIIVPASLSDAKGGFKKLKRIKGHDLSLVSVCLIKKGNVLRVAIGSAAPVPTLLKEFPSTISVEKVQEEARKNVNPIDDVRCSRDYRLFMINTYIARLMKEFGGKKAAGVKGK